MRHSRRAIAVAILQGLIRDASIAGAFGVVPFNSSADKKSFFMQATEPVACSSSSSNRTYSSRRTRATMRRKRRCAACQAAPTAVTDDMSSEQAFAVGGAEKVAELLAAENPGEVFYNRVGAINRDLSVLMANVLAEERLREKLAAGNKRKRKRATPLPPPHSPPAEEVVQGNRAGKNRRRGAAAVRVLLNRALERCSRGRWGGVEGTDGGGASPVLAKGHSSDARQKGQEEEEEGGLVILDAFAASGVRALR